jgi:hypothetical protein
MLVRGCAARQRHDERAELLGAAAWGSVALLIDGALLWVSLLPRFRMGDVWTPGPGSALLLLLLLTGVGAGLGVMAAGYQCSGARRLRCAAEGALLVLLMIPVFLLVQWVSYCRT